MFARRRRMTMGACCPVRSGLLIVAVTVALLGLPGPAAGQPDAAGASSGPADAETPDDNADSEPAAAAEPAADPPAAAKLATGPVIRPRLELDVPSVARAVRRVRESRGGWFITQSTSLFLARADLSADGLQPGEIAAVLAEVAQWPDTSLKLYIFAPDLRGRARWAIELDWPQEALRQRFEALLSLPATEKVVAGIRLEPRDDGPDRLTLGGEALAVLTARGSQSSTLASHEDLPVPDEVSVGRSDDDTDPSPMVSARWSLSGTEADTGATVFSQFSFITDVLYSGRMDDEGGWVEEIQVRWPPLSGMGAKALFNRVRQTFFVPKNVFGAVAINAPFATGLIESMAGFGPQMVLSAPGRMDMVGELGPGPIAANVDSEVCAVMQPGVGFLPAPEFVVQARTRNADRLIGALRDASRRMNEQLRERELPEPWNEDEVLGRPVFWSEGSNAYRGMFVPMVLRPVLFVSEERDAAGRDRRFLVAGWTSTSPTAFARRWLQNPRTREAIHLPSVKKTDGQAWLNWEMLYEHVVPYANVSMGAIVPGAMLPSLERAREFLSESWLNARLGYTGLTVSHTGPVALGSVVLPAMASSAAAVDESGGTDLARERLATQRLEVFFHHAKLFRQDIGRWPAELVELDGYIDFAGNPGLLRLDVSSRKKWHEFFTGIFEPEDDDEEDELDEHVPELDTSLFRIDWAEKTWRLGLAPGTLDHLEDLYIDHDGVIHRVEKRPEDERKNADAEVESSGADHRASAAASPGRWNERARPLAGRTPKDATRPSHERG